MRVVNGSVTGRGLDDIRDIAMGLAIHEAYINAVTANNPGWAIQVGVSYQTIITHNGAELIIGFSPDILLGRDGEWHLVEVKSSHPHPTHELQLASTTGY
ncbi:hypothetical protein [Vulcanisaeta sp. JCM 16161]|uniref:hypothetical protein n=1 Tax=Vulcanisaeta sp. JCM 16161 TaxID=1295372 RepID=UPI0006D08E66|nr:hypothetical protein [Vulcanisaeta sp. JCM 16161]